MNTPAKIERVLRDVCINVASVTTAGGTMLSSLPARSLCGQQQAVAQLAAHGQSWSWCSSVCPEASLGAGCWSCCCWGSAAAQSPGLRSMVLVFLCVSLFGCSLSPPCMKEAKEAHVRFLSFWLYLKQLKKQLITVLNVALAAVGCDSISQPPH